MCAMMSSDSRAKKQSYLVGELFKKIWQKGKAAASSVRRKFTPLLTAVAARIEIGVRQRLEFVFNLKFFIDVLLPFFSLGLPLDLKLAGIVQSASQYKYFLKVESFIKLFKPIQGPRTLGKNACALVNYPPRMDYE
jgi:hypothetical protein